MKPIILASKSPRRKQLLEWAEVPFTIHVADTDEIIEPGMAVDDVAITIAYEKALAVKSLYAEAIILAADTIVVIDNDIIGKPASRDEAIATLTRLSGKEHLVITGVVIMDSLEEIRFSDATHVTFHTLTNEQIEFYVDKYKPYDKAGAYAIQEWIGVIGIQSIKGDFYNVMGLPISKVVKALQSFK